MNSKRLAGLLILIFTFIMKKNKGSPIKGLVKRKNTSPLKKKNTFF
jgi:hypothetical protein